MLIGMSKFAAMLRARNVDQIFLIDVVPARDRGRPTRPGAAARPPRREVDRMTDDVSTPGVSDIADPGAAVSVDIDAELPALDEPAPGEEKE
jgi:hypothetical protein